MNYLASLTAAETNNTQISNAHFIIYFIFFLFL